MLWGAGILSTIGDQFDLIAFPWLVLLLTGGPLAVGTVIAVGNVPTVLFMLIGGSIVDRYSPRLILQLSNISRIFIGSILAVLVLTGWLNLWLLYLFALAKGIADAFSYPAHFALLPRIVTDKQLRHANAISQTTTQSSSFLGPMLAGALIAAFSGRDSVAPALDGVTTGARADMAGVGLSFAVVSAAFLVSFLLLACVRIIPESRKAAGHGGESHTAGQGGGESVWASISEGFRFVRSDAAMLTLFLLVAGIRLFIHGPIFVGVPILADTQLPQGALAVGIVFSSYAIGALLGSLSAGTLPVPTKGLGYILITTYVLSGILAMPFGFLTATWLAAVLAGVIGVMGGYRSVLFRTWLQTRTPKRMMGRVMSLLRIAAIGLAPISTAVFGGLITLSLGWVFVAAGAMMAILSIVAGGRREIGEIKMG